jgi:hypothetical protein
MSTYPYYWQFIWYIYVHFAHKSYYKFLKCKNVKEIQIFAARNLKGLVFPLVELSEITWLAGLRQRVHLITLSMLFLLHNVLWVSNKPWSAWDPWYSKRWFDYAQILWRVIIKQLLFWLCTEVIVKFVIIFFSHGNITCKIQCRTVSTYKITRDNSSCLPA